jgi:hypothetical protein
MRLVAEIDARLLHERRGSRYVLGCAARSSLVWVGVFVATQNTDQSKNAGACIWKVFR